ncbi:MAG: transglycosylase SLT domain-containing protein [Kineosporiaceae bacterium]|jgi:N-acetylmuramoyl-L-alanine amidase
MGRRRRRPIPTLGSGPDPDRLAFARTGTTPHGSAAADPLIRPDVPAGSPAPAPRPDPAAPRPAPGHVSVPEDHLELVPGGLYAAGGRQPTGEFRTPGDRPGAWPAPSTPLDALLARSRVPTRPGAPVRAALRRTAPRGRTRTSRPALPPSTPRRAARPRTRLTPSTSAASLGRTYPDAVVRAAVLNRIAARERPAPTSLQVQAMLVTAAKRYGVDPALALAVAYRESGFDQHRVSPANAIGVMQIVPSSGAWASILVGRRLDLLDAEDNVLAGVALLSCLLAIAPEPLAVAGYYQGLASVQRTGLLPDTHRYVAGVRTLRARFDKSGD